MSRFLSSILVAGALALGVVGTASATDETADVRHYLGHEGYLNTWPSVNVSVSDGVATVYGHVEGELDRRRVARVVAKAPGVREVINLVQSD